MVNKACGMERFLTDAVIIRILMTADFIRRTLSIHHRSYN